MAKYTMNDRINFVRSMINDVTKVSNETGISLEFILAQTALETGWGAKVLSGTNNLFNIKADSSWTGPTATFKVREYINGEWVYVESKFRVYSSYEESIKDWLSFLQNNPRYSEVFDPNVKGDLWKIAQAMENAGYATDPKYAEKIIATAKGPTMRNALYYYNNACWTEIYEPYQSWLDGRFNPTSRLYTTAMGPIATITRRDPLMVDINGDGIETTNVKDGAYFDHDGNGFAEQTGWAASDDGLLVMDRNNDGIINDGKELFGDQTILSNGQRATNGFEALREQDSNADGKIDANDAAWSQIKVWQDFDGDGYSSVDELHSLSDLGITAFNLNSTPSGITDDEGNTQTRTGSFEKTDGTTGTIGEYNLQRDTAYTIANEWLDVPDDIAALPDLQGYGNVYDLQQAMTRDRQTANGEGLKGVIEQFIATTDVNARGKLMDQMLFKWTNSEGIDPTSRGTNIDARKLAVLEKFFGQAFVAQNGTNPSPEAATLLKDAYRGLSEMMYSQLMAQTHLKGIYEKITYTWDDATQSVKADMSGVITDLQNLLTADSEAGKTVLGEFSRTIRGFGAQEMVKFLFLLMLLTVASIRYRSLKANPTKGVF